jgi:hypothetical protein
MSMSKNLCFLFSIKQIIKEGQIHFHKECLLKKLKIERWGIFTLWKGCPNYIIVVK